MYKGNSLGCVPGFNPIGTYPYDGCCNKGCGNSYYPPYYPGRCNNYYPPYYQGCGGGGYYPPYYQGCGGSGYYPPYNQGCGGYYPPYYPGRGCYPNYPSIDDFSRTDYDNEFDRLHDRDHFNANAFVDNVEANNTVSFYANNCYSQQRAFSDVDADHDFDKDHSCNDYHNAFSHRVHPSHF